MNNEQVSAPPDPGFDRPRNGLEPEVPEGVGFAEIGILLGHVELTLGAKDIGAILRVAEVGYAIGAILPEGLFAWHDSWDSLI